MNDAASVLYGTPASEPAQTPASEPAQTPTADVAEALYSSHKTVGDAAQTYGPAMRTIESAAVERLGMEPGEAQASVAEWAGRFQAYGLRGEQADHLVGVALGALTQPDADRSAWRSEAQSALAADYGDGAQAALADARALVSKDAALAHWLDETGLGSHPAVVRAVAERARYLKSRGKL